MFLNDFVLICKRSLFCLWSVSSEFRIDSGILDDKEVASQFEYRLAPNIKSSHHLQVACDLIKLSIVMIQVLRFNAKEVLTISFLEAGKHHPIEVSIQM